VDTDKSIKEYARRRLLVVGNIFILPPAEFLLIGYSQSVMVTNDYGANKREIDPDQVSGNFIQ
jgi:hypothetical protein